MPPNIPAIRSLNASFRRGKSFSKMPPVSAPAKQLAIKSQSPGTGNEPHAPTTDFPMASAVIAQRIHFPILIKESIATPDKHPRKAAIRRGGRKNAV
jgi:hypothetical protein